jgi:hypothetical protein
MAPLKGLIRFSQDYECQAITYFQLFYLSKFIDSILFYSR